MISQTARRRAGAIRLLLGGLAVWICGAAPAEAPARGPDRGPVLPFARVHHPATNVLELQVALTEFHSKSPERPVIWLMGVAHIGEPEYYAKIQAHLEAQALVLFEGIGASEWSRPPAEPGHPPPAEPVRETASSLQGSLARALGLVFQLDAIDYRREHFRNSDLTLGQVRALLHREDPAASGRRAAEHPDQSEGEFERLLSMVDESSWLGKLAATALQWVGANPRWQGLARVLLIETLGNLHGDLARLEGVPSGMRRLLEVLLHERNQTVLADLRQELNRANPPSSIAVFYGAAHVPHLQQALGEELDYHPAGQVWLTAFSVNLKKAGLAPAEVQWVRTLVRHHLSQLQGRRDTP